MKQRKLNKRKGFTLVELLVVIAILAVLATVSVVGYTSFTKKAKVSNDVSLTTQMNTILQANEVTDGKNATPHEAVEELVAGGLDVTKLTPTANDYNYVWDSTQNRIFLLDENNKVVSPTNLKASDKAVNLFAFVGKETELNSFKKDNKDVYSYYLKDGYDASTLTVSTGLDVGNNKINATYQTDSDTAVTIRTNGGELTVNAKNGVVYHYGTAMNVKVEAIKGESYHEYGTVDGTLTLESGHVQVEKNAEVSAIVAKPTNESTVKITVTDENTVGELVTTDTTKTTLNVPESIKPTGNLTEDQLNEMSDFAGGLGTEKSPYLVENTKQFNTIFTKYHNQMKNGKYFYFSQINDVTLNMDHGDYYFNGHYNGNNNNIVADSTISGIASVFGVSRENADIENLNVYSTKDVGLFLLAYSFNSLYTQTYFNGSASFKNVNTYSVNNDVVDLQGKNSANFGFFTYGAIYYYNAEKQITVSLNNCNNYASIIANDRCAAFIGGYDGLDDGRHAKLIMKDCNNYGNITATGDNVGAIVANTYVNYGWDSMDVQSTKEWVDLTNVKNYGIIKGKTAAAFANADSKHLLTTTYQDAIGGTYISTNGVLKDVTANIYYKDGKFNVVSTNNNYSYIAFAVIGAIDTKAGTYNSRSIDLDTVGIEKTGTQITGAHAYDRNKAIEMNIINNETILEFKYSCSSFKVAVVEKDGILNFIFDNNEVTSVDCNVNILVKAFNVSNEFVGTIEMSK